MLALGQALQATSSIKEIVPMEYWLLRKQSSGCDYTIGCGTSFSKLRASTKAEAILEITGLGENWKEQVLNGDMKFNEDFLCDCGYLSDIEPSEWSSSIKSIQLIEVSGSFDMIPTMKAKLAEAKAFEQELNAEKQKKSDLETFEALKEKLGR